MARIRTIKPEFFKNDALADLSPLHRLLFIGLWCLADREGRLKDNPRRIKAELFPYDDGDMDALLAELAAAGFILRYEAAGVACIAIPNFEKHQRITGKEAEQTSLLPGLDRGNNGEAPGAYPGAQEGKGREGKGGGGNSPDTPAPESTDLEESIPSGLPKGNGHPFSTEQLETIKASMAGQMFSPASMPSKIRHELSQYVHKGELSPDCLGAWQSLPTELKVSWFGEGIARAVAADRPAVWRVAYAAKQIGRALDNGVDLFEDGTKPRGTITQIAEKQRAATNPREYAIEWHTKGKERLTPAELIEFWASRYNHDFALGLDAAEWLARLETEGRDETLLAIVALATEAREKRQAANG